MSVHDNQDEFLQLCLERDRVLCSPEFSRSPIMHKLLTFLVDHKLDANSTKLKAYTIAVEGLGKDESFDPQVDSYPRVQIGRLRKMLDAHNAQYGRNKRLYIPIGTYEIQLISNDAEQPLQAAKDGIFVEEGIEAPDHNIHDKAMANLQADVPVIPPSEKQNQKNVWNKGYLTFTILCLIILALFLFLKEEIFSKPEPEPVLRYPTIEIAQPVLAHQERDADIAAQTFNFITSALSHFEGINTHYTGNVSENDTDYILRTNVLHGDNDIINFKLIDRITHKIIWSSNVKTTHQEDMNFNISKAVIEIAGPYGAIANHQREILNGSFALGYPCMLQQDHYMRYRNEGELEAIIDCTDATLKAFPNDAYVISRVLFAQYISVPRNFSHDHNIRAKALAKNAVQLNPDSANAKFALARTEFFNEDCASGKKWGDEAIEANPLDTRIMGYFSVYLNACGDEDAEKMAREALALDDDVDLVIPSNLALIRLLAKDYEDAYNISQHYLTGASRVDPSLLIIAAVAAAHVDKQAEAERLWLKILQKFNIPADSKARDILKRFLVNKNLINILETEIQAANLA